MNILQMMQHCNISVAKMVAFLREADEEQLDFVLHAWGQDKLIDVVPWNASDDGQWALHISLAHLGVEDEEAYIPISWGYTGRPSKLEAIDMFRKMKVTYNQL